MIKDNTQVAPSGLRAPNTMLGIGLMLCSTLAFTGMFVCIRYVSDQVHAFEAAFFRYFFGLIVLAPVFVRSGLTPLKTKRLPLHLVRGTVQACQGLLSFLAVTLAPLAKVTAMQFTAPLFAAAAAVLFFKEPLRAGRVVALVIGFAGTWIIIQPGTQALDTGTLAAMLSAVFLAANVLLVKSLARTESSITITIYQTLVTTPIALAAALFHWTWPSAGELFWLFLLGGFGTLAHLCLAEACKYADVTALMPLDYMRLVWTGLVGYFLFTEVPGSWTLIGGSVIFACGLYLVFYEKKTSNGE